MEGIFASFLLLLLCFIWNVLSKDYDNKVTSCASTIMCSVIVTIVLIDYNSKDNPTALDVYERKTTLEITYRDSVPIDTIVVYKEEFKK